MTLLRVAPFLSLGVATAFLSTSPQFVTTKNQIHHRSQELSPLNVFDVALAETVASAAALPVAFVGTGTFLLLNEEEEEGEEISFSAQSKQEDGEVDIYRDTALRYCGYANEVGEAFAPLVPAWCVPASYGVAITYVFADTIDKTRKALNGDKYKPETTLKCALIEGFDALIWQLAASVALPGFTIHQIVAITLALLNAAELSGDPIIDAIPTAVGLATIPFIVKPLDELAEVGMDVTLRKLWNPYLESQFKSD